MARILPPTEANLRMLAERLAAGELVAVPTETVYGLAADARSAAAVSRIYGVKGRPAANPLIAHYASLAQVQRDARLDSRARLLAAAFWPGPLTLVLDALPDCRVVARARAGLSTLAARCPDHPATLRLLTLCGFPLVAPSANPSGWLSPVTAEHVRQGLGARIDWILDGGATAAGIESTIVDLTRRQARILRPGSITAEMVASVIGAPCETGRDAQGEAPRAPGTAFRHYAPSRPLVLDAGPAQAPGSALLAFGPGPVPPGYRWVLNLSVAGDLGEAASNLYRYLHALDRPLVRCIAVMRVPKAGVGVAINERLARAAAGSGRDA